MILLVHGNYLEKQAHVLIREELEEKALVGKDKYRKLNAKLKNDVHWSSWLYWAMQRVYLQ